MEARKLFDMTVEQINAFDDTTVDAICTLHKAGMLKFARTVYSKTKVFADRWDTSHVGKLKLATLRTEAHDLYTKTMKFAPHTHTLGIIRDIKAYGLTAEAEHFESKVRVRHTERKKQRAKEKYTQ